MWRIPHQQSVGADRCALLPKVSSEGGAATGDTYSCGDLNSETPRHYTMYISVIKWRNAGARVVVCSPILD